MLLPMNPAAPVIKYFMKGEGIGIGRSVRYIV